jgi:hypothetical protein
MALASSLLAVFALAGCGSSSTGAVDPLTGTWSNATCFGTASTPPDITSCTVSLTFTASLDVSLTATWLSMPATAVYPGCTTTQVVTGQKWSTRSGTDMEVLTVTGAGSATTARAGCVNMTDNQTATPTTDISIDSGDTGYQLEDGTLTILSSNIAGTYKQ